MWFVLVAQNENNLVFQLTQKEWNLCFLCWVHQMHNCKGGIKIFLEEPNSLHFSAQTIGANYVLCIISIIIFVKGSTASRQDLSIVADFYEVLIILLKLFLYYYKGGTASRPNLLIGYFRDFSLRPSIQTSDLAPPHCLIIITLFCSLKQLFPSSPILGYLFFC